MTISDRYMVVQTLGVGRSGIVLEVEDLQLDRERIALKLLHEHLLSDESIRQRFSNEFLVTRQLSHPGIVRLYDLEIADPRVAYFSMELVEGLSLRSLLDRQKKLDWHHAALLLHRTLEALQYAERKSVLHRDLKPENILISADGQIKLIDFGLAQALDSSLGLTRTGETVGSPAYMAPELFAGAAATPASEVYALGIIAFEAVTGHPPFPAESFFQVSKQHAESPVPLEKLAAANAPEPVVQFIGRALLKEPSARYPSAFDAMRDLEDVAVNTPSLNVRFARTVQYAMQGRRGKSKTLFFNIVWGVLIWIGFVLFFSESKSMERISSDVLLMEQYLGSHLPFVRGMLDMPPVSYLNARSLFAAIESGDDRSMRIWCKAEPLIDAFDEERNSFVHKLVEKPRLLQQFVMCFPHAIFDRKNALNETPVTRAVRVLQPHSVATLLKAGYRKDTVDGRGLSAFHLAVQSGSSQLVEAFQEEEEGPPIQNLDKDGISPLGKAVQIGNVELVRAVLSVGVDVNQRDSRGRTALMTALQTESSDSALIIEALLNSNIDLQARDNEGHDYRWYLDRFENSAGRAIIAEHLS